MNTKLTAQDTALIAMGAALIAALIFVREYRRVKEELL